MKRRERRQRDNDVNWTTPATGKTESLIASSDDRAVFN
jgi:hypothetical protein